MKLNNVVRRKRLLSVLIIIEFLILTILGTYLLIIYNAEPIKEFDMSKCTSDYINYTEGSWCADRENNNKDSVYEILSSDEIILTPGIYTVAVAMSSEYDQNGFIYARNPKFDDSEFTKIEEASSFVVRNDEPITYYRFEIKDRSAIQFRVGYSGFGRMELTGITLYKSAICSFLVFIYALIFFVCLNLCLFAYLLSKDNKNQKIFGVVFNGVLIIACISAFAFLIIFLCRRFDPLNNSDIASQMVLAKVCADEHSLISHNWHYATEIRVLAIQAIYMPFFYLTNNWHVIRIIGNVIQYGLVFAALWFMCKSLRIQKYFLLLGLLCFLPFTAGWWDFVIINTNYALFLVYSFMTIGAVVQVANSDSRNLKIIMLIVASILAIFGGLEGLRQLFVCYVPLFVGALFLVALERKNILHEKKIDIENQYFKFFIFSSIVLLFALVGAAINYVRQLESEPRASLILSHPALTRK